MLYRRYAVTYGAAATALLFCVLAPATHAQLATHIYDLNGTLADSLGGPSLVNNGATQTANGLLFGANQGPSLSNVLSSPTYSIELYFEFNAVNGYRKIVDFKNRTSDGGLYNLNSTLTFYNSLGTGPANAVAATVPTHVIITRDNATSLFTAYVDGVSQFSFTDSSNAALFNGTNNIAYFFTDDNAVSGEASPGAVDYIRIYGTALTQAEVTNRYNNRGTFLVGAAATAPEPSAVGLLLPTLGLVTGSIIRRRNAKR